MRISPIISALAIALLGLPVPALAAKTGITDCQVISVSDSYVLKNNLPGTLGLLPSGNCLEIEADFVSISFAGYTMTGTADPFNPGTTAGITDGGIARGFTDISGGNIVRFDAGVDLAASNNVTVQGMRLFDNTTNGIIVGDKSLVTGSVVDSLGFAGNTGIEAGSGARVSGNILSRNFSFGIVADEGSAVRGNNVRETGPAINGGGFGQAGIQVVCPSSVSGNTVTVTLSSGGVRDIELLTASGSCVELNNLGNIVLVP